MFTWFLMVHSAIKLDIALCCIVKLYDGLWSTVKLYDALCYLRNVGNTMCYWHNPTRSSRRTNTINTLPDDVLAQILLRLPLDPTYVLMASTAHKKWRNIMGSNGFRNHTMAHNGRIPVLGVFTNISEDNRFISEHDLCPLIWQNFTIPYSWWWNKLYVLGCQDSWVLHHSPLQWGWMLVWDPMRNIAMVIPQPPIWQDDMYDNGIILCSRNHGEAFAHYRSRSF
jgi:hypothetical protein